MGMVFPVSTHNYELRYWLASGGINPGFYSPTDVTGTIAAEALLSVTPPPQMPATLEAGTINGYCVGEPWNQAAVFKGIGVPVITDYEIWKNNPEKVFGITAAFAEKNPNTVLALTKALIRAAMWLDENDNANRTKAVEMLSKPEYVGADKAVIANSMTGTFEYEKGDKRPVPDFNVFFRYFATYPYYSDAVWYLTQMRRWGQIAEAKDDAWYDETAKSVYRPDLYLAAAKLLVADGKAKKEDFPWDTDGYPRADVRVHRRHHLRRPQAQRLHRQPEDRPQGQAEDRRRQGRRRLNACRARSAAGRLTRSSWRPQGNRSWHWSATSSTSRRRAQARAQGAALRAHQHGCGLSQHPRPRLARAAGAHRCRRQRQAAAQGAAAGSAGAADRHRRVPRWRGPGLAPQVKTSLGAIPGPARGLDAGRRTSMPTMSPSAPRRRRSTSARMRATPRLVADGQSGGRQASQLHRQADLSRPDRHQPEDRGARLRDGDADRGAARHPLRPVARR